MVGTGDGKREECGVGTAGTECGDARLWVRDRGLRSKALRVGLWQVDSSRRVEGRR